MSYSVRQRSVALSNVLSCKVYTRSLRLKYYHLYLAIPERPLLSQFLPPCVQESADRFEASATLKLHFRPDKVHMFRLINEDSGRFVFMIGVSECFARRWESYSRTSPGQGQGLSGHERCLPLYNATSHEPYSLQISQHLKAVKLLSVLCTNG
jgi:hypothetical protein